LLFSKSDDSSAISQIILILADFGMISLKMKLFYPIFSDLGSALHCGVQLFPRFGTREPDSPAPKTSGLLLQ
jgi:hypothetical protein